LNLPEPAEAKAQAYFRRACGCLRSASKVRELRAAISMARLYRDQDKQARDLLAPSTAGSPGASTRSIMKEAKALLDELHA
jgi:predicted ATPase